MHPSQLLSQSEKSPTEIRDELLKAFRTSGHVGITSKSMGVVESNPPKAFYPYSMIRSDFEEDKGDLPTKKWIYIQAAA